MAKYAIIENAKRTVRMAFKGIAIPHLVKISDSQVVEGVEYVYGVNDHDRYLVTEKVIKFNRSALRNTSKSKADKVNPRVLGDDDSMIVKVGKPGSPERKAALAEQYAAILAAGEEVSPFGWRG